MNKDPDAEPEEAPEPDPDAVYDMMRQRKIDEDEQERHWLMSELGLAVNHIALRASFDQADLIQLLKRTRKYLDER